MWNVRKSNLRIFCQRQRSNLSGWGAVFALLDLIYTYVGFTVNTLLEKPTRMYIIYGQRSITTSHA